VLDRSGGRRIRTGEQRDPSRAELARSLARSSRAWTGRASRSEAPEAPPGPGVAGHRLIGGLKPKRGEEARRQAGALKLLCFLHLFFIFLSFFSFFLDFEL